MEVLLLDYGTPKIVADKLTAGATQAINTMAVITEILLNVIEIEILNFSSEGRRGGGSWAKLKDSTIKKKGYSHKILRTIGSKPLYSKFGSDTLFRSVTQPGAPYNITEIRNDGFEFGTDRPEADTLQLGSTKRNIAARPFLRFTARDEVRWNDMILKHLMEPFKIANKVA